MGVPIIRVTQQIIFVVTRVSMEYFLIVTTPVGEPLVLLSDIAANLAIRFSSCNLNAVTDARKRGP